MWLFDTFLYTVRAAEVFTEAINLCPQNPGYYAGRSAALLKAARFEGALEDADHAVMLQPTHSIGIVRKGQALAMLGRVDLAIETLERAQKADPRSEALELALRDVRAIAGRLQGAATGESELLDM